MKSLIKLTAALLLASGAFATHAFLVREDHGQRAEMHFLYLPSSRYLSVSSLGFKNVLADGIYIWSIQYFDTTKITWGRSFEYLWHIYDVITDLDPDFKDAYYLGSMIMSVDAEDNDMAVRILEKGASRHPDDWFFHYSAGFLRYQEGRYEDAADLFGKAMGLQGASAHIKRLHAAMLEHAGRYEDAFLMWRQICAESENIWVKNTAAGYLFSLQVKMDTLFIQQALAAYRARHGRFPGHLSVLMREGIASGMPLDPYGEPYVYDPSTGAVSCRSIRTFRKLPLSCQPS